MKRKYQPTNKDLLEEAKKEIEEYLKACKSKQSGVSQRS